jgi:hypothetical protein
MLLFLAGLLVALPSPPQPPVAGIHIDQQRRVMTIVVGPFDVAAMPPGMMHAMHDEDPGTIAQELTWPVDGWFRGFTTEVLDARGTPLSRRLLHHFTLVNYDRRTLFSPVAERIASASLESEDALAPKTIGAPMREGQRLGLYVMWRNQTGQDVQGVYLRLSLTWSPANLLPSPVATLPIVLDVNFRPGQVNTFDVPPGRSERSAEIVFPIPGRLLVVSGHLHDQGESVRLEDVETGRVVVAVAARRDPDGRVHGVARRLLALWGPGLRVEAGRRYRIVGVYNNVSGDTARHAMAELVAAFAPDDMRQWPQVDRTDPAYRQDLARYGVRTGQESARHDMHEHHMP